MWTLWITTLKRICVASRYGCIYVRSKDILQVLQKERKTELLKRGKCPWEIQERYGQIQTVEYCCCRYINIFPDVLKTRDESYYILMENFRNIMNRSITLATKWYLIQIVFFWISAAVVRRKAVETEMKLLQILLFATGKSIFLFTKFFPV